MFALVAGCSTSTHGSGAQQIDVAKVKIAATVPIPVHGLTVLSPDGRKVLNAGAGEGVCAVDVDGGKKVCLDAAAKVAFDPLYATWSPDSTRIAFTDDYFRDFHEPDIWVMDASTGKATDLTDDGVVKNPIQNTDPKEQLDLFPSWSADGKKIRFARRPDPHDEQIEIDEVRATGGAVAHLGVIEGDLTNLAALTFSPDSATMAWTMATDGGWSHTVVHIRGVGAGTDRALTASTVNADQSLLSFSPDGKYLLVDSSRFYGQYSCCAKSSASVYPVGGPVHSASQPVAAGVTALFPTWAPSGHALAFTTPVPHHSVQLVAEPGGKPRAIQSGPSMYAASNSMRLGWTAGGLLVNVDAKPVLYRLA